MTGDNPSTGASTTCEYVDNHSDFSLLVLTHVSVNTGGVLHVPDVAFEVLYIYRIKANDCCE